MTADLFAGIPVRDLHRSLAWYEAVLGAAPSFFPNDTEAVWPVSEHGYLYIEVLPHRAGHAMHTIFVDNLDERVERIRGLGIEPVLREAYDNGVRKVTYHDPDGNEIAFGGGPDE